MHQRANGGESEGARAGVRPPGFRIHPGTRTGPVKLQVSHLERSLEFYRDLLRFRVLGRTEDTARLGTSSGDSEPRDDELLVLIEDPGVRSVAPRSRLGLFHFAVLLPSRADFGRLLRHLADRGVPIGASDHGVSEALYLSDPDGLGIEIYRDRPRSDWRIRGRELRMTTGPLDAAGALEAADASGAARAWEEVPAGSRIGHVHLHVGDLDEAEAFYHGGLGLDKMVWSYPGALFLAAGGYHHHVGVNTWSGAVPPAGEMDARLLEWSLVVPEQAVVEEVKRNLEEGGYSVDRVGTGILARDPWGTTVAVVPSDSAA